MQKSSPNFYQERNMAAEQEMNVSVTSSTNSVASSGATMGQISASEAHTVPDATDHESTEEDDETSTGPEDIDQVQVEEGTETSIILIERKAQKVTKAATKRKLCATTHSHENRLEEYMDREETMSAELESLREKNLTTKRSLVSLTSVLSSRRHVDALTGDATAEEYMDAILNVNDTLNNLTEDLDAVTLREIMLGAVGSHQATATQFTIARLPSTLTKPSQGKQTRSVDW